MPFDPGFGLEAGANWFVNDPENSTFWCWNLKGPLATVAVVVPPTWQLTGAANCTNTFRGVLLPLGLLFAYSTLRMTEAPLRSAACCWKKRCEVEYVLYARADGAAAAATDKATPPRSSSAMDVVRLICSRQGSSPGAIPSSVLYTDLECALTAQLMFAITCLTCV